MSSHQGKQIIGICENKNCKQPHRRVCFDCQQVHLEKDQGFYLSDIKDKNQLKKIIEDFRQNNKQKIDQIDIQFRIQKYLLTLEMSEFLNRWRYKLIELNRASQQLKEFKKIFQTLSVEDYITGDNKDKGIFGYLGNVEEQIQLADNIKIQYLINIVNVKQNFYDSEKLNLQNNQNTKVQLFEEKCLQETLSLLSKVQGQSFQQISKSISHLQSKQIPQQDNPHVEFWEYILKQGFELKTQNLHEQFQNLKESKQIRDALGFILTSI